MCSIITIYKWKSCANNGFRIKGMEYRDNKIVVGIATKVEMINARCTVRFLKICIKDLALDMHYTWNNS